MKDNVRFVETVRTVYDAFLGKEFDYDKATTLFLSLVEKEKSKDKMMWFAIRSGIVNEFSKFRQVDRNEIKTSFSHPVVKGDETPYAREKRLKRRENARLYAQRRRENQIFRQEYAKEHNIREDQVWSHQILQSATNFRDAIASLAEERATSILRTWMCHGRPLGSCTGLDLAEAARKERLMAGGHIKAAEFYERLREATPDNVTVAEAVKANTLMPLFDLIYGQRPGIEEERAAEHKCANGAPNMTDNGRHWPAPTAAVSRKPL